MGAKKIVKKSFLTKLLEFARTAFNGMSGLFQHYLCKYHDIEATLEN